MIDSRDRKQRDQQQGERHGTTYQPYQQDGPLDPLTRIIGAANSSPNVASQMRAASASMAFKDRLQLARRA